MITKNEINLEEHNNALNDSTCGGICIFIGKVRDHNEGNKVTGLSYQAYDSMAEKTFESIIEEAKEKYSVIEVKIVHRFGDLKIGDISVWIGAQSAHRAEAFQACEYAIEELKKRAPIWKKEHYIEGPSEWVACHHDHSK